MFSSSEHDYLKSLIHLHVLHVLLQFRRSSTSLRSTSTSQQSPQHPPTFAALSTASRFRMSRGTKMASRSTSSVQNTGDDVLTVATRLRHVMTFVCGAGCWIKVASWRSWTATWTTAETTSASQRTEQETSSCTFNCRFFVIKSS